MDTQKFSRMLSSRDIMSTQLKNAVLRKKFKVSTTIYNKKRLSVPTTISA